MKLSKLSVVSFLFFTGCIMGPKTEKKNALNYLNGENYSQAPVQANIVPLLAPVAHTKDRTTVLRGRLLTAGEGIEIYPIKNMTVGLFSKGKLLQKTNTDKDGAFYFSGVFTNGDYTLRVISQDYKGELPISISTYENNDLVIKTESLR